MVLKSMSKFNKLEMHATLVFLIYIAFLWCTVSALKDLPKNFPRCRRSDPHMKECLLKATEDLRPLIIKGVPGLIPPIDLFILPEISLEQGTNAVNYKAYLQNVSLYGLDQYKFTRFELFADNLTFFFNLDLPYLYLDGKYKVDGNILIAPIKGNGGFHANLTNSACEIRVDLKLVTKHGVDYMDPTDTHTKMHIGKIIDWSFEGLFKENKEIEEATNKVIRDNLHVIVEELTPAIEKVIEELLIKVLFYPFTQIPFDKVYPK